MRFLNGVWLEESDSQPMGEPETSVELPEEITHGLRIPHPFGRDSDAMLTIRATRESGVMAAAIGIILEPEIRPEPKMDMTLLSNPRRPKIADTGEE